MGLEDFKNEVLIYIFGHQLLQVPTYDVLLYIL